MTIKELDNGFMKVAVGFKGSVLELNKLDDVQFAIGERLEPVSKFHERIFIYRLTDFERRQLKVKADNPGVIAVIQ